MKQKKIRAASIAAALVAATSVTVFAASHFLSAGDVARKLQKEELADSFADSEAVDAQVTEQGDYRFAFLGVLSGSSIGKVYADADLSETYIVIAAERLDGEPVTENETFVVSPLIQGLNPMEYNIYSMKNGGATYDVIDGVYYMITSCTDIEMFADRQIYAAVTTGPSYAAGYRFDESTGRITRREDFDGINVLFQVPMDASKADRAAQERYLADWGNEEDVALPPFSGDAGTVPMREGMSVFENEAVNFVASVDYKKLAEADLRNVIALMVKCEEGTAEEKDGCFYINYNNEHMTGTSMIQADYYEEESTYFDVVGACDTGITFEYQCLTGGTLHYAVYDCDLEQVQAIYDYFHH